MGTPQQMTDMADNKNRDTQLFVGDKIKMLLKLHPYQ